MATMILFHRLAAVALGDFDRKEITRSMMWMTVVVLLMVAARQRARDSIYQRIEKEGSTADRGAVLAPIGKLSRATGVLPTVHGREAHATVVG